MQPGRVGPDRGAVTLRYPTPVIVGLLTVNVRSVGNAQHFLVGGRLFLQYRLAVDQIGEAGERRTVKELFSIGATAREALPVRSCPGRTGCA